MNHQTGEIRIYIACLAAYNSGILHGRWINAEQDAKDINKAISEMLAASPIAGAEEYAIHDYEGFEGIKLSEYCDIQTVADYANFIAEHGPLGGKLVAHYGDIKTARTAIDDHYKGCFSSAEAFAQHLTEETSYIPEHLQYYIDYEKMARDLAINDVLTIETGFEEVHIFWSF